MASDALIELQKKKGMLSTSSIIFKRSNLKEKVVDIWDVPDPVPEYRRCFDCHRKFKRHEEIRIRGVTTIPLQYCRKCAITICDCLDPECEHNDEWREGFPTFVNACAIKSIQHIRPILRTPVMFKQPGNKKVQVVYGVSNNTSNRLEVRIVI